MKYGYFDDKRKEYVITTPETPLPWINYLGTEDFFSLLSNTCGGYSFYKDARLLRLTRYRYNSVPSDSSGHYIYIREGDTFWNPGWMPSKTPLDSFRAFEAFLLKLYMLDGFAYSSLKYGIIASSTRSSIFVVALLSKYIMLL